MPCLPYAIFNVRVTRYLQLTLQIPNVFSAYQQHCNKFILRALALHTHRLSGGG